MIVISAEPLQEMRDPIFEVASDNYRDEHRLFAQMIMSKGVVEVALLSYPTKV